MFQKNDNRTKKKLIYQYKTTIASYTKENNKLLSEIEDLKMTLNLNQDLLYQSISAKFGENEKIKNLINRSKALWKNNETLIEKKNNTEMEIDHLQKEMEQIPSKIQTEINNISSQNSKKRIELTQKDNNIKKLKKELEKTRKSAFFKTARTEVLVTEPTKANLEINQELIDTKSILLKVSNKHSKEKKKSDKLGKEVRNLKDEMKKLKKTAINLYNKINNKNQIIDSVRTNKSISEENNFLINMGYNASIENEDKNVEYEEEEEEESEESSSDESSSSNERRTNKNKTKEFENLMEQLKKLEKQNKECLAKIDNYKNTYKKLKNQIEDLKKSNNNEKEK